MYLNVIVCTSGGDHPEAERPVLIPILLLLLLLLQLGMLLRLLSGLMAGHTQVKQNLIIQIRIIIFLVL